MDLLDGCLLLLAKVLSPKQKREKKADVLHNAFTEMLFVSETVQAIILCVVVID